ncbi:radical SAM protein [Nannocystis punicea]|uniref:Radical SAM protein n=1 Tax=Nannocystis punicea TaxID=2995304 RepID=A0ABY7GW04_9BACT|nr:radical SAM protein [Nannocystis poenicansa]WAS91069.1 radical SAM protein [Nannocystis poenicansa]
MSGARDLEVHLRALVGGLAPGDELAPGLRLAEVTTECGPRLTFETGGTRVHVEVARLAPGRRSAVQTRRLGLSYRFDEAVSPDRRALGVTVCRAVAAAAAGREEAVLAALARDAEMAEETGDEPGARVRAVTVERLLERAEGGRYYTVTPYVGCLIGCRFCYAQSHVAETRALLGLAPAPWGSYVDVRVNAPAVLAAELQRAPPRPIKFCAVVSDPYHAIERRHELTRRMLLALRDAQWTAGVLLLTRSALIERDLDVLPAIANAWAGISIPTIDDAARRHFEPRAAAIADRLAALRACRAAGLRTFAIVQPLLPGPVAPLADALAEHAGSVRVDVLHGVEGATQEFADARWAAAANGDWQRSQAAALTAALRERGVPLWAGELPPELDGDSDMS